MNRYMCVLVTFIAFAQQALCAVDEVNPELKSSLKTHSGDPNIFSIIFALVFVIFLIYVTGLIYSKLNLVGAQAIKDQLKNYDLNSIIVLSTKQLGQGKNLHVIELNKKRYLIGAAANSISLLKELGEAEQLDESEPEILVGEPEVDEFDVHKKYLQG